MSQPLRAIACLPLAVALVAAPAAAHAEAPALIPVQGALTDAEGIPLDGNVAVTFKLWDAPTDGAMLHSETMTLQVKQGFFTAYLGSGNALDLALFRDVGTVYLGITVEDDPEMTPRLEVGTIPFAAFAQHAGDAQTLQGSSPDEFAGVGHGHDWGDITGVPADLADGDDDTTYTAGPGLTLSGTELAADQATIEDWARGVCFDTAAEVTDAIGPHYTDTDAVAAMGALADTNSLNHDRYTDAESVAAMGALADTNSLNHDRYTDAESVAAMGALADTNSLNHDRYTGTEAITDVANSGMTMSACPSNYTLQATNLCMSAWRSSVPFFTAQADCLDEGAHVCTYAEFHVMWNVASTNPGFLTGDWIGDVVGDDTVLCVNDTGDSTNFEGTCDKSENHPYRCCIGRGR